MNIGDKFGRLVVLKLLAPLRKPNTRAKVRCDCGIIKIVGRNNLTTGRTKSCGCLNKEQATRHGHCVGGSRTLLYAAWVNMIQRCFNPKHKAYLYYGGRGITVCKRWLKSFSNFVLDMGTRPMGHSLDRRKVNGNYTPFNCRWATAKQQSQNRRVCVNGRRV